MNIKIKSELDQGLVMISFMYYFSVTQNKLMPLKVADRRLATTPQDNNSLSTGWEV